MTELHHSFHEQWSAFQRNGDIATAVAYVRQLQATDLPFSDQWRLLAALGTLATNCGALAVAEQTYTDMLELDPTDPGAMMGLASTLRLAGQPADALGLLNRLIESPDDVAEISRIVIVALMARCLFDQGDYDECERVGRSCVEYVSQYALGCETVLGAGALRTVALSCVARGDHPGADSYYQQAIDRLHPMRPEYAFLKDLLIDERAHLGRQPDRVPGC
ncbi:MAG TPA: tetratricopeptide repeat protein [Capsulimonadaceae bacterium]